MEVKGTSLRYSKKCMLGNFSCFFLLSAVLFKVLQFQENCSDIPLRVENRLDPDQAPQNVGPDQGPNCLPKKNTVFRPDIERLAFFCQKSH